MEVKATAKYITISPLKVRRALVGLRGLPVSEAEARLTAAPDLASKAVAKVLKSAVANAENNHDLDVDDLVVAQAFVGNGLVMKRFAARGRGRSGRVYKPFSQLTIIVRQVEAEAAA